MVSPNVRGLTSLGNKEHKRKTIYTRGNKGRDHENKVNLNVIKRTIRETYEDSNSITYTPWQHL
jgi:hypothetical protein